MYQNPHNYQNYPPFAPQPPWPTPQPPPPPPPNLQVPPNGPPFLPPKPEINTLSTGGFPWTGNQVSSPLGMVPDVPRQWGPTPGPSEPVPDHQAYSLPPQSAVPRVRNMIPPEHVKMLDGGTPALESMPPSGSQYHLSSAYQNANAFSPAMSHAALFPQSMVASPMSVSSYGSSLPPTPAMANTSMSLASPSELPPRPPSQVLFTPPPPPPPLLNRGVTPAPHAHTLPPPIAQPQPMLPPPIATHHSEPQVHMSHLQSPVRARHSSVPVFSPGQTHTPMPTAPTPAPSFPVPMVGTPAPVQAVNTSNW
ncbi:hypothetical protein FRC11_006144, partial [Ceratobasidium sp. 423]